MFLYLACPASISLAICGVGHPLTIIIWFNKVVVVVVVVKNIYIFSYCSHMRRRLTAVLTVSVTSVTVSVVRAVIPRAASSARVGRRV